MDKFIVKGGNQLNGRIKINGAKNAVLPIMAATLITPGKYVLNNVPDLRDTRTMSKLLEIIGAQVRFNNSVMEIDSRSCANPVAPYKLVKTMRASFDVLGALLSRFGYAKVSLPGGCAWGPRPVNLHLKAIEKLGAKVTLENGYIIAEGKLSGTEINFEISSVGATKNAMMAAVTANGTTIIRNAAREPEVSDLAHFLTKMGADISGIDSTELVINGVNEFVNELEYEIIPDRIEAGTFLIGAALIGGDITLSNIHYRHLSGVIQKLKETGAKLDLTENSIRIRSVDEIKPVDVTTAPYPGFPTDLQAQWMALMTNASGNSVIIDEIYRDRFTHVAELIRLGAKIKLEDNVATVAGVTQLTGAPVMSTDIRASASLILAALSASGSSEISRIYHIDRGYEQIETKFKKLGVNIIRES